MRRRCAFRSALRWSLDTHDGRSGDKYNGAIAMVWSFPTLAVALTRRKVADLPASEARTC
jgi:hypothetical protein